MSGVLRSYVQMNDTCPVGAPFALWLWWVRADAHFRPALAVILVPPPLIFHLQHCSRVWSTSSLHHTFSILSPPSLWARRAAWQAYSSAPSAARRPPRHSQINFLLRDAGSGGPQIPHPHLTHPQGPVEFFADFSATPKMSICIVESEGQGKRLQPCRFLCLRASWLWQCLQPRLQRGSSHHWGRLGNTHITQR